MTTLGVTGGKAAESYNVQDSGVSVSLAGPAAASSTVTKCPKNALRGVLYRQ